MVFPGPHRALMIFETSSVREEVFLTGSKNAVDLLVLSTARGDVSLARGDTWQTGKVKGNRGPIKPFGEAFGQAPMGVPFVPTRLILWAHDTLNTARA